MRMKWMQSPLINKHFYLPVSIRAGADRRQGVSLLSDGRVFSGLSQQSRRPMLVRAGSCRRFMKLLPAQGRPQSTHNDSTKFKLGLPDVQSGGSDSFITLIFRGAFSVKDQWLYFLVEKEARNNVCVYASYCPLTTRGGPNNYR